MKCRHCAQALGSCILDLATAPPANAYIRHSALNASERYYPLKVYVCDACWLVQLQDFAGAEELFSEDYAYFSSISQSWLKHSEAYVADMVARFGLGPDSMIAEIAANDGYLLQYVKERGIPCYGVEPTAAAAGLARAKGIEIFQVFFGEKAGADLAVDGRDADLIVANNVLAHVPDINDFLRGFKRLLKPQGVATFEFPHLLNLVSNVQFDTVYHEHYSYLSLVALDTIFTKNGLMLFDVEELPTHGGSLRCFVQRLESGGRHLTHAVPAMLQRERDAGIDNRGYYDGLQHKAERIKNDFITYLINAKRNGLSVAGYGAAAKGNTLINYAGIHSDLLSFVVDNNPQKQGKYLPGSRIPIVSEDVLCTYKPDRVVILPWNLVDELSARLRFIDGWGGKIVRFFPKVEEIAVVR